MFQSLAIVLLRVVMLTAMFRPTQVCIKILLRDVLTPFEKWWYGHCGLLHLGNIESIDKHLLIITRIHISPSEAVIQLRNTVIQSLLFLRFEIIKPLLFLLQMRKRTSAQVVLQTQTSTYRHQRVL